MIHRPVVNLSAAAAFAAASSSVNINKSLPKPPKKEKLTLFKDDTRSTFPHGSIQLQTEYPFYEPGNTVNGMIFIKLSSTIHNVEGLEIEVKGGAKNSFKYPVQEMHKSQETGIQNMTVKIT